MPRTRQQPRVAGRQLLRHTSAFSAVGVCIATGSYTGDGNATQAMIGVGFLPRLLMVYSRDAVLPNQIKGWKSDIDGLNAYFWWNGGDRWRWKPDYIISLNADGFTVGDGTGDIGNLYNILNVTYSYIAWK